MMEKGKPHHSSPQWQESCCKERNISSHSHRIEEEIMFSNCNGTLGRWEKHAFIKYSKALFFRFEMAVGEDGRSLEIFKNLLAECARIDNCIAVWLIGMRV